jgi:acyl-CoA thioester hydrolase
VRFGETDLMGIVHHATYLTYFEAGRVEWLRRRGVTYADWARGGLHLPVVEAGLRYRSPARFDDLLQLETRLADLRSHSVRFEYALRRGEALLCEGFTRLACVDDAHALRRLSDDMVAILVGGERA